MIVRHIVRIAITLLLVVPSVAIAQRITNEAHRLTFGIVENTQADVRSIGGAPMSVSVIDTPCVNVHDLDFGTIGVNQARALHLRICNDGGGIVSFDNPSGGDVLEWIETRFTVWRGDIERVKNARLGRGDCITLVVTFSSQVIGQFRDTARFWASTRHCRDISEWRGNVTIWGPKLTGFDWNNRWIVQGACNPPESPRGTKNPATEYVSRINTFNTGDADFVVADFKLVGADFDAGHFALGTDEVISRGTKIRPVNRTDTFRVFQTVIFKPGADERVYSCEAVLTSDDGKVVRDTLRGVGIESHVQAPAVDDHGRHQFVPNTTSNISRVFVRTDGTRDATVKDVVLVPDNPASAGQFTILNRDSIIDAANNPHPRNSAFPVTIEYQPTAPGSHSAELRVIGDFSPCDDSTTQVVGESYTLSARPHDVAYGTILTCFDSTSQAYVENDGSDPVTLHGVSMIGGNGAFAVATPALPVTIPAGERFAVDVTFRPTDAITYTGSITFDVRDANGVVPVYHNGNPVTVRITGTGARVSLSAHIARTYRSLAGSSIIVDVVVDNAEPTARIDSLSFTLRYAHGMMTEAVDPHNLGKLVRGTILEGWTIWMSSFRTVDPINDTMTVIFLQFKAPQGQYLDATGVAIRIPFVTFCGAGEHSELPFELVPTSRSECAVIESSPGLAAVECIQGEAGVNLRAEHDRDAGEVVVTFVNPGDDQPVVALYNTLGELVADLGPVQAGGDARIRLTSSTSGLSTGQYYVVLRIGDLEIVRKVMILP